LSPGRRRLDLFLLVYGSFTEGFDTPDFKDRKGAARRVDVSRPLKAEQAARRVRPCS